MGATVNGWWVVAGDMMEDTGVDGEVDKEVDKRVDYEVDDDVTRLARVCADCQWWVGVGRQVVTPRLTADPGPIASETFHGTRHTEPNPAVRYKSTVKPN